MRSSCWNAAGEVESRVGVGGDQESRFVQGQVFLGGLHQLQPPPRRVHGPSLLTARAAPVGSGLMHFDPDGGYGVTGVTVARASERPSRAGRAGRAGRAWRAGPARRALGPSPAGWQVAGGGPAPGGGCPGVFSRLAVAQMYRLCGLSGGGREVCGGVLVGRLLLQRLAVCAGGPRSLYTKRSVGVRGSGGHRGLRRVAGCPGFQPVGGCSDVQALWAERWRARGLYGGCPGWAFFAPEVAACGGGPRKSVCPATRWRQGGRAC